MGSLNDENKFKVDEKNNKYNIQKNIQITKDENNLNEFYHKL